MAKKNTQVEAKPRPDIANIKRTSDVAHADYVFTLNRGTDGSPNTGDDIVTGTNGDGVVSTRTGSTTTQTISWGWTMSGKRFTRAAMISRVSSTESVVCEV